MKKQKNLEEKKEKKEEKQLLSRITIAADDEQSPLWLDEDGMWLI